LLKTQKCCAVDPKLELFGALYILYHHTRMHALVPFFLNFILNYYTIFIYFVFLCCYKKPSLIVLLFVYL